MHDEPYLLVPLRRRDGTICAHALIDEADRALTEHNWCLDRYVVRSIYSGGGQRKVYLHRTILGLVHGDKRVVDHINGDPLDCRRRNLRIATPALNGQNVRAHGGTSEHRGVGWHCGKWRAGAKVNGKSVHLGRFTDELEAAAVARAYRLAHMPFTNEER